MPSELSFIPSAIMPFAIFLIFPRSSGICSFPAISDSIYRLSNVISIFCIDRFTSCTPFCFKKYLIKSSRLSLRNKYSRLEISSGVTVKTTFLSYVGRYSSAHFRVNLSAYSFMRSSRSLNRASFACHNGQYGSLNDRFGEEYG